jgi:cyclohexyl-isocyanide hydratase
MTIITIGIPVYDGVDLLDVAGPHEMLGWMNEAGKPPRVALHLIAEEAGEVTTRDGVTLKAPVGFAEAPKLDVLWVPGGDVEALKRLMYASCPTYLDFLRAQAATAQYVCSVCEGALLLAQAGLLDGYCVTTHWAFINCLKAYPDVKVAEGTPRFVHDRNRLTGGGISSGLDEALKLIELLAGTEIAIGVQQTTQYYPAPPVASCLPAPGPCPLDG